MTLTDSILTFLSIMVGGAFGLFIYTVWRHLRR